MLRNLNATYAGKRILASPTIGVLASVIAAETAEGDNGPGILYNESIDPAYTGKYLRAWITNPPTVGTLSVAENGAIEGYDLPVGTHVFNYDLIVNDAYNSSSSFTVAVGVVDASATGGTGVGTGSGTGGDAVGTIATSVPGGTGTGTGSGTGGDAMGVSAGDAVISGGTGTGVGSGYGGDVLAIANAETTGGISTGTGSGAGGDAVGGIAGYATWPLPADVRLGITYGPTGTEYTGTMSGASVDYGQIAAAVLAALQGTTIPVDAQKMNGATIYGDGTADNKWRGYV